MIDPSDEALGTVSLQPERAHDLPAGARNGRAAALKVPCSTGPASRLLQDELLSPQELMAREAPVEPARQMEAGTEWDERARIRLEPLTPPLP